MCFMSFRRVSLIAAGKNARALEVFKLNQQLHPAEKFVTFVGLARGYTAVGDKANVIKNWEIALRNIPESRKAQQPVYENALKKIEGRGVVSKPTQVALRNGCVGRAMLRRPELEHLLD
jgi:hypothetical protein